ncbi:hypothetical protein NLI96_g7977 [Meripilus lineatus]|uniref:Uncharacterized protein n=1 Tax=Meripilus lineatus TaxID=2056292 RepID=A0AAD5V033_9APHY|nr:hypothetical protein NLI96_g7977 [Physisporinus lineatus]
MNLYIEEKSPENAEIMCMKYIVDGWQELAKEILNLSYPKATGRTFSMTSASLCLPEDWKDKLAQVTYDEVMRPIEVLVFPLNFEWSHNFPLSVIRNRPFILKNHPYVMDVAQLSINKELEYYCHKTTTWVKFLPHHGIDMGDSKLLLIKAPQVKGYLFLPSRFQESVVGDEKEEAWSDDQ